MHSRSFARASCGRLPVNYDRKSLLPCLVEERVEHSAEFQEGPIGAHVVLVWLGVVRIELGLGRVVAQRVGTADCKLAGGCVQLGPVGRRLSGDLEAKRQEDDGQEAQTLRLLEVEVKDVAEGEAGV